MIINLSGAERLPIAVFFNSKNYSPPILIKLYLIAIKSPFSIALVANDDYSDYIFQNLYPNLKCKFTAASLSFSSYPTDLATITNAYTLKPSHNLPSALLFHYNTL